MTETWSIVGYIRHCICMTIYDIIQQNSSYVNDLFYLQSSRKLKHNFIASLLILNGEFMCVGERQYAHS